YGEISRDTEGPQTAVHCAAVQLPVAAAIQLPQARAGIEDPDLGCPRASPVPDHWKLAGGPKRPQVAIHRVAVPLSVTVEVQPPDALTGTVDTDHVRAGTGLPAADHREIFGCPKRPQTAVYTAAVPDAIAVT